MSDGMMTALVAGCVAITVAWLTQFVAEGYKRHRDGSALAAALAGELSSHGSALGSLKAIFTQWIGLIEGGRRNEMTIFHFEKQRDLVLGNI
ncbi:hypothetical protein D9M72_193740 [compost metagenome]